MACQRRQQVATGANTLESRASTRDSEAADGRLRIEVGELRAENSELRSLLQQTRDELARARQTCARYELDAEEQEAAARELRDALEDFLEQHTENQSHQLMPRSLENNSFSAAIRAGYSAFAPAHAAIMDRSTDVTDDHLHPGPATTSGRSPLPKSMRRDPIGGLSSMIAKLAQDRQNRVSPHTGMPARKRQASPPASRSEGTETVGSPAMEDVRSPLSSISHGQDLSPVAQRLANMHIRVEEAKKPPMPATSVRVLPEVPPVAASRSVDASTARTRIGVTSKLTTFQRGSAVEDTSRSLPSGVTTRRGYRRGGADSGGLGPSIADRVKALRETRPFR